MLCGGWITDRVFGGRAARACFFYMVGCTGALFCFGSCRNQTWISSTILLCLAGFFIYGPQSLIGTAAAKLATKRAAAAAIGLTSVFGYLSTAVSGVGIGALVDRYGWDAGFLVFVVCSVVGVLLFVLCWPAKADGYVDSSSAALEVWKPTYRSWIRQNSEHYHWPPNSCESGYLRTLV